MEKTRRFVDTVYHLETLLPIDVSETIPLAYIKN